MIQKIVNIAFILFFILQINAQNFESYFGTNETHVIQINNDYTLGMYPYSIDSLAINNTIITSDNLVLKEVEHFRYYDPDNAVDTYYLREDKTSGKLWVRSSIDGSEYLIADMTLEVGDSTTIFSPYSTVTVSDVTYINGKKHIYFNSPYYPGGFPGVAYSSDNLFFKEGVIPFMVWESIIFQTSGNFLGLYGESAPVCVTKDGIETFSIDNYWSISTVPYQYDEWVFCHMVDLYYNPISTTAFKKHQFSIYPNPAETNLKLIHKNQNISKLEVFDIWGKLMLTNDHNFDAIDVSGLQNGLDFLSITSDFGSQALKFYKK
jgi:hypothetical protein